MDEPAMVLTDLEVLKRELSSSQSRCVLLAAEVSRIASDKNFLVREVEEVLRSAREREKRLEQLLENARCESENERQIASLSREALVKEKENLAEALRSLEQISAMVRSIESSFSWRATKPLRALMRLLRGRAS